MMINNDDICAELEIMHAAYGSDFRKLEETDKIVRFSVKVYGGNDQKLTCDATISLLPDYPILPLSCIIDGLLPSSVLYDINKSLQRKLSEEIEMRSMDVCQWVSDYLSEYDEREKLKIAVSNVEDKVLEIKIARFLIYFHHIMSSTKRKAIVENAQELKLGGISKTGFPGVVIVEGLLENVLEYVRRIQRLRWQQMVVRGEEVEIVDDTSNNIGEDTVCEKKGSIGMIGGDRTHKEIGNSVHSTNAVNGTSRNIITAYTTDEIINRHRKISTQFYELPQTTTEGSMSAVGAFCKDCHIHALFMTAMKKYDVTN